MTVETKMNFVKENMFMQNANIKPADQPTHLFIPTSAVLFEDKTVVDKFVRLVF